MGALDCTARRKQQQIIAAVAWVLLTVTGPDYVMLSESAVAGESKHPFTPNNPANKRFFDCDSLAFAFAQNDSVLNPLRRLSLLVSPAIGIQNR